MEINLRYAASQIGLLTLFLCPFMSNPHMNKFQKVKLDWSSMFHLLNKTSKNIPKLVLEITSLNLKSFISTHFPASSLKTDAKWTEYKVVSDFFSKMMANKMQIRIYDTFVAHDLKVGAIGGGAISLCFKHYCAIAALEMSFFDSFSRVLSGVGVSRLDLIRCRDYIFFFSLGYSKEIVIIEKIARMAFLSFPIVGSSVCEDLKGCDPFPVYDNVDLVIYRSTTGYQCFGTNAKKAEEFLIDVPYMAHRRISYNCDGTVVADPAEFVRKLRLDMSLLYSSQVYSQLMWLLTQGYNTSMVKGLLNISHYMLYGERNSTRCVVLQGKSGVGKSTCIDEITRGKSVYFLRYDPKIKTFFDGYYGQDIIVIDDLGHYSKDEWLPLIKWLSPCTSIMPMANVSNIGIIPMVSSLILITTNCLNKLRKLPQETYEAIGRRIDLIEVSRDNFCTKLYRPQLKTFVNTGEFKRNILNDYLQSYLDFVEVKYSVSIVGHVLKCVGNVLEYNPFSKVVVKIYDVLMHQYKFVGELVYHGYATVGNPNKISRWIPRELKKSFYRLSKDVQKSLISKLLAYYYIQNGEIRFDLESSGEFLSEGRTNDTLFNYDMWKLPVMQPRACLDTFTPVFDVRPYISREEVMLDNDSGYARYNIQNLEGIAKQWVQPGTFDFPIRRINGELNYSFARLPISHDLFYTKDESEWKPNMPISRHTRYDVLNEWLHPRKTSNAKTIKRRLQRLRGKRCSALA